MGGNQSQAPPQLAHFDEYRQDFTNQSRGYQAAPKQSRGCQDICCLITFFILLIVFIAIGAYYINQERPLTNIGKLTTNTKPTASRRHNQSPPVDLTKALPVILGMAAFAVVLAIVLVFLMAKFPKCMVYTMLVLTLLIFIILGIVFAMKQIWAGAIVMLIIVLLLLCIFCCCKQYIETGIVLLKVGGQFLLEKPGVFCTPFFIGILVFIFFIFWTLSVVSFQLADQKNHPTTSKKEPSGQNFLTLLWMFYALFFTYMFFYMMVFLIATAVGLWFFNIDDNFFTKGMGWIFGSHIGSLTFASIIITIITMIRNAVQNERDANADNMCCYVCLCCLSCLIRSIEELVKTLNNNAVIVMSFSGQDYVSCAKSAIYLIFENYGTFMAVDIITFLITFCGTLLVAGLPSLVGYFLLKQIDPNSDFIAIGVVIIFFACIFVSVVYMSVVSQSLSSVFIYYCLDQRFKEMGYDRSYVPKPLRNMFDDFGPNSQNNMNQGGYQQPPPPPPQQGGYQQYPYNQQGYQGY